MPPVVVVHVEATKLAPLEQLVQHVTACGQGLHQPTACQQQVPADRRRARCARRQEPTRAGQPARQRQAPLSLFLHRAAPLPELTLDCLQRRALALLPVVNRLKGWQHDALPVACRMEGRRQTNGKLRRCEVRGSRGERGRRGNPNHHITPPTAAPPTAAAAAHPSRGAAGRTSSGRGSCLTARGWAGSLRPAAARSPSGSAAAPCCAGR